MPSDIEKEADWAYTRAQQHYYLQDDWYANRNAEVARIGYHLLVGSSGEEARLSCATPKVEIYVNGKLYKTTEDWRDEHNRRLEDG